MTQPKKTTKQSTNSSKRSQASPKYGIRRDNLYRVLNMTAAKLDIHAKGWRAALEDCKIEESDVDCCVLAHIEKNMVDEHGDPLNLWSHKKLGITKQDTFNLCFLIPNHTYDVSRLDISIQVQNFWTKAIRS